MAEERELTQKQKRFCDEYLVDCNATQAAIRAGYAVYLPILFGVLVCFAVVAVVMYFWLK